MSDWLVYFWLLLKASLFSTGGTGNLPSLHADLIGRGWAEERQFVEALAIGQISPGPNGLWVICLGYLTAGLGGALLATLAICLPPVCILLIERLHRRVGDHPAMDGFLRGLGLAVSALLVVVVLTLLRGGGVDWRSLGLVAGGAILGASDRVPVPLLLLLAGLAGVVVY